MKCSPTSFNDMEFFEFKWMFDRIGKQLAEERKQKSGGNQSMSLENLIGGNQ